MYFQRDKFEILEIMPDRSELGKSVRAWDLAASTPKKKNPEPDYTAGVKLTEFKRHKGWLIENIKRFRATPSVVEWEMRARAKGDRVETTIKLAQDPGQAGLSQVQQLTAMLQGYKVVSKRETGDKETRAAGVSAQALVGNIYLLRGPWNEEFLNEAENFPEGRFDDQIDALSAAFAELAGDGEPQIFMV